MIYTHVLKVDGIGVRSPLDALTSSTAPAVGAVPRGPLRIGKAPESGFLRAARTRLAVMLTARRER